MIMGREPEGSDHADEGYLRGLNSRLHPAVRRGSFGDSIQVGRSMSMHARRCLNARSNLIGCVNALECCTGGACYQSCSPRHQSAQRFQRATSVPRHTTCVAHLQAQQGVGSASGARPRHMPAGASQSSSGYNGRPAQARLYFPHDHSAVQGRCKE